MLERKTVTIFIENGVYYAQRDMDGQPSIAAEPCVELGPARPGTSERPPASAVHALRHYFDLKNVKIEWFCWRNTAAPRWSGFYKLRERA